MNVSFNGYNEGIVTFEAESSVEAGLKTVLIFQMLCSE